MAIDWAGINWKKGFNRLWLFISVVIGVIMFIYAYNSISPEEAPLVAIVYFVIVFIGGHVTFRVFLWIIKGFRDKG